MSVAILTICNCGLTEILLFVNSGSISLKEGKINILLFICLVHDGHRLIIKILVVIQKSSPLLISIRFILDNRFDTFQPCKELLLNLYHSCSTLVLVGEQLVFVSLSGSVVGVKDAHLVHTVVIMKSTSSRFQFRQISNCLILSFLQFLELFLRLFGFVDTHHSKMIANDWF